MALSLKKTNEAYDILKSYNGDNPYIIMLKNDVYAYKCLSLNDFHIEYILKNYNYKPIYLNKIIKIAKWFGEQKQKDWNVDFIPEKLLITYIIGETDTTYNVYVRYRQSQEKAVMCFIPKKALLTQLFIESYEDKNIDFEKYNKISGRKLKPHQETGIKFLTTRKKCILADDMGLGKTTTAIVSAIEDDYKRILIICPASVKSSWKREITNYNNEDEIVIVEGSKWKENKFTIINYDILDNFYEIPTETVIKRIRNVDDNGKITYTNVEKTIVSKKQSVIDEAMENSQLFQSNFDLIIIDEIHRLSNNTSGRYKIISDLIRRTNPTGIYALTGTPITNRPYNLYNILKLIDAEITKDWQYYVKTYCDGKQIYRKGERDKWTRIFLNKVKKKSWYDLDENEKNDLNRYLEGNCSKIWLTNGASNLDELREKIKHLYIRRLNTEIEGMVKKEIKTIEYDLPYSDKIEYENVWNEYEEAQTLKGNDEISKNKAIIEGTILRQWLSNKMISNTVELANKHIENGEKVLIICCYDDELYEFQRIYGDKCVIYNGKMTRKQKDKAEESFMKDDNIRVFVGNIQAAGVGITLTSGNICIFNNFSFVPADNLQAMDRIFRLTQVNDVTVYYQIFKNTVLEDMFKKVIRKEFIINNVIIDEEKK
jgi:SWI/SNF-related matrix-associated actin-dependent regulator 1 of chromatin subfamily A